jgi:hypothetical protein
LSASPTPQKPLPDEASAGSTCGCGGSKITLRASSMNFSNTRSERCSMFSSSLSPSGIVGSILRSTSIVPFIRILLNSALMSTDAHR